jgi:hypothetical protein
MGKTVTPKYHAFYRTNVNPRGWNDIMWKGRPTDANAEDFRKMLNKSFNEGGSNYHISKAEGVILHVIEVQVRRNVRNGEVVASAKAPMFEVV